MKTIHKITHVLVALAALLCMTGMAVSCSDDYDGYHTSTEIGALTPTLTAKTVSSLSFRWLLLHQTAATAYEWRLTDSEGGIVQQGTTETNTVTVDNLPDGTEFCFYVKAVPAAGSRFTSALEGSVKAATVKDLSWQVTGTYYRDCENAIGLYNTYERTMTFTAATGVYTISNFYDTGTDLEFKLDGNIICPKGTDGTFASASQGYWMVPLGNTEAGLETYIGSGYCEFSGNEDAGYVFFYYFYYPNAADNATYYWAYDWFEWGV